MHNALRGRAQVAVPVSLAMAVLIGASFGSFARWAMAAATGPLLSGQDGWRLWLASMIVRLTSGTWGWGVFAVGIVWLLTRGAPIAGLHRWLWCWSVATTLLTVVTVFWYRLPVTDVRAIGYATLLCTIVGAGTGFVSAFLTRPGLTGLAARICLPLGLASIILAGGDRGCGAWVEGVVGVVVAALLIWRHDHPCRRRQEAGSA